MWSVMFISPSRGWTFLIVFSFMETRGDGGLYASAVVVLRKEGTPRFLSVSVSASPGTAMVSG